METTIKRQLKGVQMEQLFDAQHEQFMIKFYNAQGIKNDEQYNRSKVYNFEIIIRHADNENAEQLFDDAKNKMFPKRKAREPKKRIFFVSTEKSREKGKISYYIAEIIQNKGLKLIDNDFKVSKQSHRGQFTEAVHRLVELKIIPNCIDKAGYIDHKKKNFTIITVEATALAYINEI